MAGASRLARFNITSNPQPSNPGRPGKKYFVGMPIPAGAGVIAAVVHFFSGEPLDAPWMTLHLAAHRRLRGLPHGEHMAVLQFQGHRFSFAPSISADSVSRRAVRVDLVLFEAGTFRDRAFLHAFRHILAADVAFPA